MMTIFFMKNSNTGGNNSTEKDGNVIPEEEKIMERWR